jgi:hypothetical protein
VARWEGAGEGGPETFTFEEHDGKTTLTTRSTFPTMEERDAVPVPLDRALERGHRIDPAGEVLDDLDLGVCPRPDPAEELHDHPFADDVGRVRLLDADGPLGLPGPRPMDVPKLP